MIQFIMKKFYILILFSFTLAFSQYNENAPWLQNIPESKKTTLTIDEEVLLFNEYWKLHNRNERGSGYKPFMRWENYWRELTDNDGKIIPSEVFWKIWSDKNKSRLNKNNSSSLALPVSNWSALGPFTHSNTGSWSSGQGRVNTICVDPNNSNTIYVGAPAGGIWKSTNNGLTWNPLSDKLPQIGVSGIAVDYSNSNIIYIATGDRDSSNTYSVGVLKSIDGGLTWNTTGLSFTGSSSKAGDLIAHPTNNQILWCATNTGIFKTINAGTTWTNVRTGNFAQGSIRLKPNDPSVVYAVNSTNFYKSIDSGSTFITANTTAGIPTGASRMIMDVTPANPDCIYILAVKPATSNPTNYGLLGIYRSLNSGDNWIKTSGTTDVLESRQSSYDLALAVSSTNENEIYTGCLNIWKSINGGATVTKLNSWSAPTSVKYTHADIHFLGFFGNKLFCGSDGGIYVSSNSGSNFTSLTAGLQIGQFYRLSVAKQTVTKMVGGLQDNGGYGYSNNLWKNFYGADGMDTAIDSNNNDLYYGFIQYGSSLYISSTSGNSRTSYVDAPVDETSGTDSGGNWITPLAMNNSSELFAGYSKLYKLVDLAWVDQSTTSDLGTGDIEIIAIDPSNDDIMYVVNGSTLYKSVDRGLTFVTLYNASTLINSICVHSTNSDLLFITTSGVTGQVLKSVNGGINFVSISAGLPSISKNSIKHQANHSLNPLYVGTSLGVYYRDDSMAQWEPFDTNLPNVSIRDLEINLVDNKIVAATYGRGVWISPIPVESILSTNEFQLKNISIYPNPSSGLFNITSGDKKINDVIVYDITGKKLMSILSYAKGNFQNILDLSSLSSGTYFVEIQVENQKIIKRLVKK